MIYYENKTILLNNLINNVFFYFLLVVLQDTFSTSIESLTSASFIVASLRCPDLNLSLLFTAMVVTVILWDLH